ncbi:FMN-dependent NADH-azoreductase [Marinithermus hydrothermalis]|uniref:FMN dependent NADH:quinone oxidoreductase n=1 Tax=Marinithermus hydrothermalis (strain DSM 14884 / JCM 11576 / T1) TaxID=869210 RepID=F2NLR3_MARHT|nr:FMN-dependent NADH-azoreductase [Marinithermus hydrothermalis]AEB10893.1 FMN-dependent NADH-azoreductase [Marinithermus hydrothermalis DSM 14884]
MRNVLYVKANPKPLDQSVSLQLGQRFLEAYRTANPNAQITELDLYATHLPLLDADVFNAWNKLAQNTPLTETEAAKTARLNELVEEFLASDLIVFAAPMWNFGYPPLLKAYMDAVIVAGKTFRYTESGFEGLAKGKTAVILEARGGVYSTPPMNAFEHTQSYLRAALNFIGITDVHTVIAEGMNQHPDRAQSIIQEALDQAAALARKLAEPVGA